jgi:hypothetical protein
MFCFNLLAFYALGQIIGYVLLQSRPIKLLPGGSNHFLVSWVTSVGSFMYFTHDEPLQEITIGYVQSVSVGEQTSLSLRVAFIFYCNGFLL